MKKDPSRIRREVQNSTSVQSVCTAVELKTTRSNAPDVNIAYGLYVYFYLRPFSQIRIYYFVYPGTKYPGNNIFVEYVPKFSTHAVLLIIPVVQ